MEYKKLFIDACSSNDEHVAIFLLDRINDDVFCLKHLPTQFTKLKKMLENRAKKNKKILLVEYEMSGYDHGDDGYCSSLEADDDYFFKKKHLEVMISYSYKKEDFELKEGEWVLKKCFYSEFIINNEGCTNQNGSGYCKGFFQHYEPVKIVWIQNIFSSL